jgi:hypothetical protein
MYSLIKDYPTIYSYSKTRKINKWKLEIKNFVDEGPYVMNGIYLIYPTKFGMTYAPITKCTKGRSIIEQAIYEGDKLYDNRLKKTINLITDIKIIEDIEKNNK